MEDSENKPEYLKDLLENLREIVPSVTQEQVEEALSELVATEGTLYSLSNLLEMFILDKARINLFDEHEEAIDVFGRFLSLKMIPLEKTVIYNKILDRETALRNSSSEKPFMAYARIFQDYRNQGLATMPQQFLSNNFTHHLIITQQLISDSLRLVFEKRAFSPAILIRPAFESAIKAMFLEHLKNENIRQTIKKYEHHSSNRIVNFILFTEEKAKSAGVTVEKILAQYSYDSSKIVVTKEDQKRDVSLDQMIKWLCRNGVFHPIPNPQKTLCDFKKKLNSATHVNLENMFLNQFRNVMYDEENMLGEIRSLVDHLMLGSLNTANNINPTRTKQTIMLSKRSIALYPGQEAEIDNAQQGKTYFENLLRDLEEGSLQFTRERLSELSQ